MRCVDNVGCSSSSGHGDGPSLQPVNLRRAAPFSSQLALVPFPSQTAAFRDPTRPDVVVVCSSSGGV